MNTKKVGETKLTKEERKLAAIAADTQTQETIERQREDEKIICEYFSVRDSGMVSRPRMIKAISRLKRTIDKMILEIFIGNPDHQIFAGCKESELASMRVARIKRISGDEIEKEMET